MSTDTIKALARNCVEIIFNQKRLDLIDELASQNIVEDLANRP